MTYWHQKTGRIWEKVGEIGGLVPKTDEKYQKLNWLETQSYQGFEGSGTKTEPIFCIVANESCTHLSINIGKSLAFLVPR